MNTQISQTFYKGYTIEPTTSGAPYGGFDFFPTEEGRDEDYDWTGDGWRNCGNVRFASTIDEAKDAIDEKIMASIPDHIVEFNGRTWHFPWISEAVDFASYWNFNLHPICNA